MATNREVKVKITLDENLKSQMSKLARETQAGGKKMEGGFKGAASAVGKLAASYAALKAAGMAVQFIWDSAKKAGDLNEALSKQATVFRGLEKEVNRYNDTLTESYGLSRREAAQFTSTIQDTLVPLGLAREKAGEMSFEVVKLARDLASFNNLPTEQVVRDIQSAMVGNSETVRKYGVSINQASIVQKALEDGLIATKNELTPTTKALATLKLVMEGSTDAMGDFERTSDSFNNQLVVVGTSWEDFQAALGQFITNSPGVNAGLSLITSALKSLAEAMEVDNIDKKSARLIQLNQDLREFQFEIRAIKQAGKIFPLSDADIADIRGYESAIKSIKAEIKELNKAPVEPKKPKPANDQVDSAAELRRRNKERLEAIQEAQAKEIASVNSHSERVTERTQQEFERYKRIKADEVRVARETADAKASIAMNYAGALTTLASINKNASAENFAIYKAAATAEAIIAGILAVQKTLGSGGVLAVPLAISMGAMTAANVVQIQSQSPPKFAEGGIVGGTSFHGDQVVTRQNSGEMDLNMSQQRSLFNAINNGKFGGANLHVGGDTIVIQGNADEETVAAISQTRERQLSNLRDMIKELNASGQL